MRILQITHRLPYPPIDGGKKGILGFAREYSARLGRENFALFCLAPREEQDVDLSELKTLASVCQVTYGDYRNKPLGLIWNTLFCRFTSYNMQKYISPRILGELVSLVQRFRPDAIHCDHLHMAWYTCELKRRFPGVVIMLREHNVESTIVSRYAEREANLVKKRLLVWQAQKLARYEAQSLARFDLVLPITDQDAGRVAAMAPGVHQVTVPAGTNFAPKLPLSSAWNQSPRRLVSVAAMDWLPNQDGLVWFIEEVMSRLRAEGEDVILEIAGKNTPPDFHKHACQDVHIHGFVPDLSKILSEAMLAIVPLHVGGGMRVKILDYFGQGVPVVSTSIGVEGICSANDKCALIADTPQAFAEAIQRLLRDQALREEIRTNSYRKCCDTYSWPAIVDQVLQALYRLCKP